ncbi:hypothetical protein [Patulibacter americanus]|uniref:hypothetical protein n=1 Tax=Patulibacter americanus TaxID=588672 RepID=UPI0003B53D6B|nr:hypothetical protein [Patulibacter americanus]
MPTPWKTANAIRRASRESREARQRGDAVALRRQLERAVAFRAPADAIAMILRETRGLTTHGVPEAVAAVLEDRTNTRHVRRSAAYTLGTLPCAVARDALRRAADGTDPDRGMRSQASDALQAMRDRTAAY